MMYDITKANERIAYERYQESVKGRVFFDLFEKVNMRDFLKRFELQFVDADDYSDITVINHKETFLNDFPMEYRHMNGYVVARKDEKYIAKHVYLFKNPCFGEIEKFHDFFQRANKIISTWDGVLFDDGTSDLEC